MKKLASVKIGNTEKLNLFINLGTMLKAGIPILEIVDSLLEDTKGNLKIILETLREDLSQGKNISVSFAKFPRTFDPVTLSVLRAAEESGTLDASMKDIQVNIRKGIEFSDKVRAAMLYPTAILVVFILVILVILIFVIPKISVVFTSLKVVMPLPTRILIFTSNILLGYWYFVIAGLAALTALGVFIFMKKGRWLTNKFLAIPGIAKMAREIDLTKFSRSMSLLLSAGIPITTALELAAQTVIKNDLAIAIEYSRDMVLSGKKLSEGFKKYKKLVPKIMIKIIEAGEQSGTLSESFQFLSEHLDYQVTNSLHTFTVLLEPVMLVVIGVIVGGIMLSIIGPIYSLIGQISPR